MRKFLTTLLAASAIAAPASALADEPGSNGPRGRTHMGQRDNDKDNSSESRARPPRGERSDGDRPRFERPANSDRPMAVERARSERPAIDRADRPDRGPPEWKMERAHGRDADANARPVIRERERPGDSATARQTQRTREQWTRRPGTTDQHRDRPEGSFNRPSTSTARHGDTRTWSRTWRDDRKYDWRNYRDRNRSVFRVGIYADPYGYQYRRWNIGWSMRPFYYRSSYWIADPWQYRLPQVYGPYRWVRYYDDAILVNTWTGEVEDVIYNFFW